MELMIVVVILSILALIAYPSYQGQVAKSRRGDAKAALTELSLFMERYFTQNTTYVGATLPFTETPRQGSIKFYDLTLPGGALTATTYTIRAAPKNGQAGDGFLELTQAGVKRWDADNSGAISGSENVWE
jgi:type IV pilus assembly protein PilE